MNAPLRDFGSMLRAFRNLRGMSQSVLSQRAHVSTRHLSFVETGRSEPSRELVRRLAHALDIPPRERAALFEAAGYAAPVRRTPLDHASMAAARGIVERMVHAHVHCPAVAVDRRLDLLLANPAALAFARFVTGSDDPARASNLARFTLVELLPHAEGANELAGIVLARLRHELAGTSDASLVDELAALAPGAHEPAVPSVEPAYPLRLRIRGERLAFLTAITTLGTPMDLTLHELRIETLMPLDDVTERRMRELLSGV